MAPTMKYWDDWVDAEDMAAMWDDIDVSAEWIAAGEKAGLKVHMSRNSDGKPYVTQTEMKAMATIVICRHFKDKLDPLMICAIAEIESDRQPLAYRFEPKLGEASTGLMQTLQSTAEWFARPFVSVYFGAAFLMWVSTYGGKAQSEEFMVRAYNGGPKHTTSKSTLVYWNKYLAAKKSLQSLENRSRLHEGQNTKKSLALASTKDVVASRGKTKQSLLPQASASTKDSVVSPGKTKESSLPQSLVSTTDSVASSGTKWVYWDEKTSLDDMDTLWRNNEVKKEWLKSGEQVGKVRFARDSELRPYLTRAELKAVAEAVLLRHFKEGRLNPGMLCAVAEICSKRLLYGLESANGILSLSLATAQWLHNTLGYKAYSIHSVEDFSRPFVSMYFAASYMSWLSTFEGRQRNDQFIVKAYLVGPQNVNTQLAGPYWLRYLEALTHYQQQKARNHKLCSIQ
eukprot:c22811_g1_i3 orf=433-1797(+)